MSLRQILVILLLLSVQPVKAVSIDTDREKRIATELAERLVSGEIIWLKSLAGREFPAIYYEAFRGHHDTGIVILHGLGAHPDWPDVIAPLRRDLPGFGWPTLSIQLPILAPDRPVSLYGETVKRAKQRIFAAVTYLLDAGFNHVVLLGYGFGAATGADYLATEEHRVSGFVSVSILARKFLSPGLNLDAALQTITVPLLDIFGSRDNSYVVKHAADRRLAQKTAGNDRYQQVEIPFADHYYTEQTAVLVETIRDWIQSIKPVFPADIEEE